MSNTDINWRRLARALDFYAERGFLEAELPWHAPFDVCAITFDDEQRMYRFDDEILVGSAEQSFLQAQKKGILSSGRYVSLTPCFRREPVETETHQRYFMKVELFAAHDNQQATVLEFVDLAREFMQRETSHPVEIIKTPEGYDLEIGGIEVGSYSARAAAGMIWTCGTGLAEPRFSVATSKADVQRCA